MALGFVQSLTEYEYQKSFFLVFIIITGTKALSEP
jgi:hypothetical protein